MFCTVLRTNNKYFAKEPKHVVDADVVLYVGGRN